MVAVSATKRAAAPAAPDDIPPLLETTPEEGRAIFDQEARRQLGISGEEFLRRWYAGAYASDPDQPDVMDLVMLLPLVQPTHGPTKR